MPLPDKYDSLLLFAAGSRVLGVPLLSSDSVRSSSPRSSEKDY